jgi:hypothetical protein
MYFMLLTVQSPGDNKENSAKSHLSIAHILVRFKTIIFWKQVKNVSATPVMIFIHKYNIKMLRSNSGKS